MNKQRDKDNPNIHKKRLEEFKKIFSSDKKNFARQNVIVKKLLSDESKYVAQEINRSNIKYDVEPEEKKVPKDLPILNQVFSYSRDRVAKQLNLIR